MKSLKKILLTMAMTIALGTSAFAASGFEFLLNVSSGVLVPIPNKEAKDVELKGYPLFFVGVDAQIGYMFQVVDRFGISLLAELGYALDEYRLDGPNHSITELSLYYEYHSFRIGLLPKFNIGLGGRHGLAIGIGGGVKIPIAGFFEYGYEEPYPSTNFIGIKQEIKRQDIVDIFSPSVIGYMKATFDYYLFFTDRIAMNFGFYLGGDFGMKIKETKIRSDAFDFGLQLGFRFGPKA